MSVSIQKETNLVSIWILISHSLWIDFLVNIVAIPHLLLNLVVLSIA